jgi:hypothetical protein
MKTKVDKYAEALSKSVSNFITLELVTAWKTYKNLIKVTFKAGYTKKRPIRLAVNQRHQDKLSTLCAAYGYIFYLCRGF